VTDGDDDDCSRHRPWDCNSLCKVSIPILLASHITKCYNKTIICKKANCKMNETRLELKSFVLMF
jgi:hypothetical protein